MTSRRLDQLARRWRWQTAVREALFALAAAGALSALALLWPAVPWLIPILGPLILLAMRLAVIRPSDLDSTLLARHLDRAYPALEESSALWLRSPESLALLERLQLKRIDAALAELAPEAAQRSLGEPPRQYLRTAAWCLLGGSLAAALAFAAAVHRRHFEAAPRPAALRPAFRAPPTLPPPSPVLPKIVGGELFIVPPAYTSRPPRRVNGFDAEVEEGASVTWRVALDRPVRDARFVFGEAGADSLALHPAPGAGTRFEGTGSVSDSGIYHLSAVLTDGTAWSPPELFSLRVLRDHPPAVRILQPVLPRTLLDPPAAPLTIESLASDDYGLVEAHIVATVAKGSGEAVKFREQSFAFDTNEPSAPDPGAPPGARRLTKTLDLAALGLQPGDELYFFIEARDNRQPIANRTRSETRFVTIKGPSDQAPAGGLGVAGVNLVPKYFRSERQLIIDTEKLIADRPTLPEAEFRSRANDLGVDQQFLRLRYGQFVGEDYEQSAVTDHAEIHLDPLQAAAPARTGPRAAASIALRFRQEHAEQDREGVDEAHETGLRAQPDRPLSAAQVRAPYVDQHDSQDKATFFDHETKGTLHDALGSMWEAEGYLRTVRPADALAPEHRALEIIKDLQQSDRAYVQHVGFDSAPLQIAERRLQGDVAGVAPRAGEPSEAPPNDAAANELEDVRAALEAVPWNQPPAIFTQPQIRALRRVEPVLTAAANRQLEAALDGLRALRGLLADGAFRNAGDFQLLERALLHLLPVANRLPDRARDPEPSMSGPYFEALKLAP